MKPPQPQPTAAALRARKYRAAKKRKALEAAAAATDERDAERDGQAGKPTQVRPSIAASTENALAAMKWIKDSDGALVDMARLYSLQIDEILYRDPEATGKAASLGQLLTRILHELGGTPTVRLQHELRSMRMDAAADAMSGGDDAGSDEEDPRENASSRRGGATVTPIKRPPKRKRA